MSVLCINGCGRQTNEKSGVCVICKLFGNNSHSREGGNPDGGVEMKEKKCIDCGEGYQPTGNSQKRCTKCREMKKDSGQDGMTKERSRMSHAAPGTEQANIGSKGGSAAESETNNIITKLIDARNQKQQEMAELDTAIEAVKRYVLYAE